MFIYAEPFIPLIFYRDLDQAFLFTLFNVLNQVGIYPNIYVLLWLIWFGYAEPLLSYY
jgi:hypothetical protein